VKTKGHLHLATYCKELLPFGASVSVSALTTLLPFTDVGSENQGIKVVLENSDPTNTCTLIVDVSHAGTYPDLLRRQQATAQPQDECSVELHDLMDTYIRISAQSPGTVSVKFGIVARER
jgi:hypothetical protein